MVSARRDHYHRAKSGYGLTTADELKILRVIRELGAEGSLRTVPTFLGAHEVPDEYRGRRRDYIRLLIEEMLPAVWREGLAESCDVFCEPSVFPSKRRAASWKRRALASAYACTPISSAPMKARCWPRRWRRHRGSSGSDYRAGWTALAAAHVQPVLLPASVCCLGTHRYPAARQMIERGLAVTLGTDFNPGSSPTTSMPLVLSLAVTN